MQDSSNFGKSILDNVNALKNRCKELEKELTFTKTLLNDMSAIAQKNEDLKNTAEYRLGKEIEKNKELETALLKSAETASRFCDSMKDYTQTVSHLSNENAMLSQKLKDCENRAETIAKDARKSTLRSIWMDTALQCLEDGSNVTLQGDGLFLVFQDKSRDEMLQYTIDNGGEISQRVVRIDEIA